MFNPFASKDKKKSPHQTVALKISGMHCTSCAVNIDLELEDIKGVVSADTSYTSSVTTVTYNPELVSVSDLQSAIASLGYQAQIVTP